VASVVVDLAAALVCFSGQCHPALVGDTTPRGTFRLAHYSTDDPGYGGDLLAFHGVEGPGRTVLAVHRVLDPPGQHRLERLRSGRPSDRRRVTAGCINVEPAVYDSLVDCCSDSEIEIR
jgi:hypothetical protein